MQNTMNKVYLHEEQYWENFEHVPNPNINISKQKQITQRMKLKDYKIIETEKVISRPPSYYKFDRSTTLILQMLIDRKLSGDFHNVVGKGANSVVLHAHCYGSYHIYFPDGNAVKVYTLSKCAEKNNGIFKTVQKEYEHLDILRSQHFSNNTPHPVYKNKNVLITSFIGTNQETAPSISTLPIENLKDAYSEIVKEMDTWYKQLGLIHGSLSYRKILWNNKLYFIGWSHSVKRDHPLALKKLMKDCQFVSVFFKSRGVPAKTAEELFKAITGQDKISSKVLEVVHKDLWKDPRSSNPNRTATPNSRPTQSRFKC